MCALLSMGDRIRALSIIVTTLLLGSFGLYQESFAITADETTEEIEINESNTRPTFGLSHENNNKIVDSGFSFNNQKFAITDNFHTPFTELPVNIGELNFFDAKVYADQGLKVQEFLFGIPQKGDAHLAELGIEVWFDLFGEIQDIKVIQKSNVIDIDSVTATQQKTKCHSSVRENCIVTSVSMIFLEPLRDKVMAIKAIDYKNRYQITYLNEGIDVSGDSLNPMNTIMIPSSERDEGLILLTQTEKYSHYWTTEDGRIFERNNFGSFKQINQTFEQIQDTGEIRTRVHSGFGGIIAYEQERATDVFDSTKLISELSDYVTPSPLKFSERINKEMKEKIESEQERAIEMFDASELISELPDYIPYSPPVISERINKEMKEKIESEQMRATDVFDANELISELPDSFSYNFTNNERMDEEMKEKMLEQEKICQNLLNKYTSKLRTLP